MQDQKTKLYDRQIQLFGEETQDKISKLTVYVNSIDSTTSEILKNLVLTGFNIIFFDSRKITKNDIDVNPLIDSIDFKEQILISTVIEKKLKELNPFS